MVFCRLLYATVARPFNISIAVMSIIGTRPHSSSSYAQVLVACADHVLVVDADSAQSQAHGAGPILALAVAPNGAFVAGFTHEGRLIVWTADFTKVLSEFETEADGPPKALAWCGTDSVVVCLEVGRARCDACSGVQWGYAWIHDRQATQPTSFALASTNLGNRSMLACCVCCLLSFPTLQAMSF